MNALEPLRGQEAVRYFDGAVPTWRHAISNLVPRLSHADRLKGRLQQGLADTAASTLQIVRAAGGEGKSTALLQVAADAQALEPMRARAREGGLVFIEIPEFTDDVHDLEGLSQIEHALLAHDGAEGGPPEAGNRM